MSAVIPEESSDDQAETISTSHGHQITTGHDTPSSNKSDSDENEPNEPPLDLNDINKLNVTTLRNKLIELTLCKQAETSASYKKPSHCSTFHHELSCINDAMKEMPKLTTKNCITKPGDKKFNWKLDRNLCMILQSHAKLTGTDNINYLFIQTAKAKPWRLHKLYSHLKKDLTKMEHIAELTLLNEASRIQMFNTDVQKLVADINKHWAKAESMGYNLTRVLKIKTLIDQTKFIATYQNCITNLQDNG
ncbi:hypothetical protein NDA10_006372 [Ustilago hordei]|nr:hypothetical protein NDA10_006372 [Ustilago hordei]